jgi:hypothetical protein
MKLRRSVSMVITLSFVVRPLGKERWAYGTGVILI